MPSNTLCQKKTLPSIKLLSNNGNMCNKKAFKICINWIKQNIGVWSWIYPKVELKVARKTIHRKFVSQNYRWKLYVRREKGWKNVYKMPRNAYIASRNVSNMYIVLFIYTQLNEKQVSLCPLSTNLMNEEVMSVLANIVKSVNLRAWYGLSTRFTWAQIFALAIFQLFACFWSFQQSFPQWIDILTLVIQQSFTRV